MIKQTHKPVKSKPIRRFLIAGLLVWLPIVATFLVVRFLVDLLDKSVALLPKAYQPDVFLGMHIPGLGVILSLVIVLLTGMIVTNFLGRRLVTFGEAILAKIPLVRSIYNGVKQILETILKKDSPSFRKVLLIEYPRKGIRSIVFQTSAPQQSKGQSNHGEELVTVFLPTTPNPTSGFLLMVPQKDIIELDMSIDDALKMIISLGVVQPCDVNHFLKKTSPNIS